MPRTSTGTVLNVTCQLLNYYGLERQLIANPADGALSIEAALFRATTDRTPNAFLGDDALAQLLIDTNETVQGALRWISAALPTDAPHDPNTDIDDHLEHIRTWVNDIDFFTQRQPSVSDVIGVLKRAAQLANTLTDIPAPRAAA
ncbi:hypothetical protein [Streptomyces sp. Wb2n-11]|uniref:hypothetical protein n=1 Tax=Streptomyces sp. Wb2n-11 TaxID=1030533 RepID=UPI000A58C299|nr:hypothetical protein [Streptomyces sp. Wb2n-11]